MPRRAERHLYNHGPNVIARRRRSCARCSLLGAVGLAVLGMPLVIFNAPACFFTDDADMKELHAQRAANLRRYNDSMSAWRARGRARCLGLGPLHVRVSEVDLGGGSLVHATQLQVLASGDRLLDLEPDDAAPPPLPLRYVAPEPIQTTALLPSGARRAPAAGAMLRFELYGARRPGCAADWRAAGCRPVGSFELVLAHGAAGATARIAGRLPSAHPGRVVVPRVI